MAENYKWLVLNSVIKRLSDGANIPNDGANKDWRDFQTWLLTPGNVPQDADPPPTSAEILAGDRAVALNELLDAHSNSKLIRAVFLVALDEVNNLRQRDVDNHADVAAAASLANLQTRWAARAPLAARTIAQFKNAVQSKITAGDAD